ncbi:chemotaxis response regulator protein-glutamate methylesterase [Geobacter sp. OR-1]|uniref:chemotaxis-specific protein-glutamate methyltransferase CheB n=1 Tax=Geobacter sp. OR-1 TaxID=1266765 RepID=UPI000542A651|nr:chemotaxis-specific protein-glutamate methyltransferase CheB [Geobacter sp. OR-1]GAM10260.1 chemotaxis response regulator protein-glutamate methylesterase [Geobacter sp. OR-1]
MIKVLVVDDSPVVREFVTNILNSTPDIRVIGTAANGEEAIEAVRDNKPDVVTMDVHMPKMDGFEATRIIMETVPVPIVIVSGSVDPREVSMTFRAVEAGAVAFVAKPAGKGHPNHEKDVKELLQNIRAMSGVRVVRRRPREDNRPVQPGKTASRETRAIGVVAMGASTGGPVVIQRILASLPRGFPAPVLIVQHMANGFTKGFAEWLAQSSGIPVKLAVHGELLSPGCAYVGPDGFDMLVESKGRITLRKGDNNKGPCPSVSCLFRSVAEVYGANAIGVLLTGMGKDGAEELRLMKEQGAVTMAQDEESSIVYGMPGAANRLKAATYILSPDSIIEVLKRLMANRPG